MSSAWERVPDNVLHIITPVLARDDLASVAKVWPEAVQDNILKEFVPGGMPICEACSKRVFDSSLRAFLELDDPTYTIEVLPDDDDYATALIADEVVTLLVRGVMNKGYKQSGSDTCYLCNNKPKNRGSS